MLYGFSYFWVLKFISIFLFKSNNYDTSETMKICVSYYSALLSHNNRNIPTTKKMKTLVIPDIDDLMTNRQGFNSFVYTPLDQAVKELEFRKNNQSISQFVSCHLPMGVPAVFENEKNAVLARQLATPNFEFMKFSDVVSKLSGFKNVVMEMHKDKFTPADNVTKYHLGKLVFSNGTMHGGVNTSIMTVDFNKYSGKKLSEVKTVWGQSLVDFHNELLQYSVENHFTSNTTLFEASKWVSKLGKSASEYYTNFLSLFLQNGILFENFLLKEKAEYIFIREVFLPAFIKIIQETGKKPLIVSYLPIETEGVNFWNYYPVEYYEFVNNKFKMAKMDQPNIVTQ